MMSSSTLMTTERPIRRLQPPMPFGLEGHDLFVRMSGTADALRVPSAVLDQDVSDASAWPFDRLPVVARVSPVDKLINGEPSERHDQD